MGLLGSAKTDAVAREFADTDLSTLAYKLSRATETQR